MVNVIELIKARTKAPGLYRETPLKAVRYCFVDTELTGLDHRKDNIVSIGAVRVMGGRISVGDSFYRLVNPEKAMSRASVVIHGITPSDVGEKPSIDEVISEFVDFCGTDVLVGHCISIDLEFINREMRRITGHPLGNDAVDTLALHEWLAARHRTYGELGSGGRETALYAIAHRFGIPSNGAHNAEMDAFIAAQVFQRFIPLLIETGVETVGELLKIGDPLKGGDRFRKTGEFSNM
ncbi:MAG TPA: 3'-5' exonuclease [Nitrospirota bacterium]|nr:3'-5' exonuclease [Nitrospirota bacterium]